MRNLQVDPAYLVSLANKQVEAEDAFTKAHSQSAGLAESVKQTHGVVCTESGEALIGCEQSLQQVLAAMQECSRRLADNLGLAQSAYREADPNAF